MEWYGPLTILPAIGLILLSTSNFIIALNNEIYELEKGEGNLWIIKEKLKQLKRLGAANSLLYSSAIFLLVSSLVKAIINSELLFKSLMVVSTAIITTALIILLIHSIKAVSIRQKNLKI